MPLPHHDFHIHTWRMGCGGPEMVVADIIDHCAGAGCTAIAVTDHHYKGEDLQIHREIRSDIEAIGNSPIDVYFGVELNYDAESDSFLFTAADRERLGFQVVLGALHGAHVTDDYSVEKLLAAQHEHHLRICADPLIDVLPHPWGLHRNQFRRLGWPWFDSMKHVPASLARELAQASRETGTALEINTSSHLVADEHHDEDYVKSYINYVAILAEAGALFAFGSDAHALVTLETIELAWQAAEDLDIRPAQIWTPPRGPLIHGVGRP